MTNPRGHKTVPTLHGFLNTIGYMQRVGCARCDFNTIFRCIRAFHADHAAIACVAAVNKKGAVIV
ncbi:MAG: hypothetical protein WAT12_10915 [Candidatus Nitrotoga sp.]